VRLESRNGVDHTRRFPDLAVAVATLPLRTLVLDGEVAIFNRQFRLRFDWLRDPDPVGVATPPLLMVFDLLYRAGRDQTKRPYETAERGSRRSWRTLSGSSRCGG
jgi:bifunctional non-homologous end joining protein LigD